MTSPLGEALDRAFAKAEPIRFLQIGGNDGVHMDPLYRFHVERSFHFQWGHIFEPIPEYFELLKTNMRPFEYVTCHNVAVDDSAAPGTRELSYISLSDVEKHGLPPSSKGLGSFSRDRNPLGGLGYDDGKFNMIKSHIRTMQVKTVPAKHVAQRYADANLLVTDCEGYDVEIIRAAFDGTGFRPKVIQFEQPRHSSTLLKAALRELRAIGYAITPGKDFICELQ